MNRQSQRPVASAEPTEHGTANIHQADAEFATADGQLRHNRDHRRFTGPRALAAERASHASAPV